MEAGKLIEMALKARENAYCPYSKFAVGAALLCEDGTVYTGCNVENAAYPVGLCAERCAMSKAVSEGNKKFKAIAIAGSSKEKCTPCGMCRQFMFEFAPSLTVYAVNCDGEYDTYSLGKDLLKGGFGPDSL